MVVQERKGLHFVIYFAVACQTLGGWLRYAGHDKRHFSLLVVGSLVAGPAMACFMSTPSVLAALWFAENQRATAVAIASLSGVLGMLVGLSWVLL
jgi:predicted MFS family arabinose efflux permease